MQTQVILHFVNVIYISKSRHFLRNKSEIMNVFSSTEMVDETTPILKSVSQITWLQIGEWWIKKNIDGIELGLIFNTVVEYGGISFSFEPGTFCILKRFSL